MQIVGNISVTKAEHEGKNAILLVANDELDDTNAKHGLYRALIANMVKGVSEGFSKSVSINGVGYKVIKYNRKSLTKGYTYGSLLLKEIGADINE